VAYSLFNALRRTKASLQSSFLQVLTLIILFEVFDPKIHRKGPNSSHSRQRSVDTKLAGSSETKIGIG
jgi:hypothetical protein